ncbi:MAG: AAA family ATPase, partial [Gammaproteobacteria bacterium]|nr:AAA family ATPase [Gammaproteobacteria bacterium]
MTDQFFLTRQTANLMEDFVREISHTSSMFLLYGNDGVGKSRLLLQLISSRLSELNSHWIDFKQTDESVNGDMAAWVNRSAEAAEPGDIIVFDHFEMASNKAQHQIFQSWSTEGKDKKLNFIIAASNDGFNTFRQLAQQFHTEARSFQLMPCSQEEAEAFLHVAVFPEEPLGKLDIPRPIRMQIRAANGIFTRLNEIVLRDADSFSIKPEAEPFSIRRTRYTMGLLALLLLLLGTVYWQNISEQSVQAPTVTFDGVDEVEDLVVDVEEPTATTTVKPEPEKTEVPVEITIEKVETNEVLPKRAVDNSPVDPLEALLEASLEWIEQSDKTRGTIQVMTIGFDKFVPATFLEYLAQLES